MTTTVTTINSTKKRPPELKNRKLIVVSNREPVQVERDAFAVQLKKTAGGLVSALDPVLQSCNGMWICWDGEHPNGDDPVSSLTPINMPYAIHKVKVSASEIERYYYNISNQLIWPLFHYFKPDYVFNPQDWKTYTQVNQKFARAIIEYAAPRDLVWIQDYHLMQTPQLVRELRPHANLGFFCHIPFPHYEVFRTLPVAKEVLKGLLGSDIIGFHTESYGQYFMECCKTMLPEEVEILDDHHLIYNARKIQIRACPISIDFQAIHHLAADATVKEASRDLRQSFSGSRWLGIGVDRLDYTKGILERLECLELLLEKHPEYEKQLTFIQIAVPSRTRIPEYQSLKTKIDEAVGRINGRFSRDGWSPVYYLYKGFPLEELIKYYVAADFALVNPLRDGMNLVAKEYCAAQTSDTGCLLLSEITGSAEQLKESYLINPYNYTNVVDTLHQALQSSRPEKIRRMAALRRTLQRDTINTWLNDFLWHFCTAIHNRHELSIPTKPHLVDVGL